jgi:hypothetical protein
MQPTKKPVRSGEFPLTAAISRLFAAKQHSFGYLFHRFHDAVKESPAEVKPILTKVCALYGLYNIQEFAGNFLQYGYFSAQQIDFVKAKVRRWFAIELTLGVGYVSGCA